MCLQEDDYSLSDAQINQLMKEVDENGDGEIDYNEFSRMMMK